MDYMHKINNLIRGVQILYDTISETELPFTVSGDQLEAEAELTLPK